MIYQMGICVKEGGPAVGPPFINVREGSVEEWPGVRNGLQITDASL